MGAFGRCAAHRGEPHRNPWREATTADAQGAASGRQQPAAPAKRGQHNPPYRNPGRPPAMTSTNHHSGEYGMWTETFTQLHHAATTGEPVEEIRRLEATELDELHARGEQP